MNRSEIKSALLLNKRFGIRYTLLGDIFNKCFVHFSHSIKASFSCDAVVYQLCCIRVNPKEGCYNNVTDTMLFVKEDLFGYQWVVSVIDFSQDFVSIYYIQSKILPSVYCDYFIFNDNGQDLLLLYVGSKTHFLSNKFLYYISNVYRYWSIAKRQ